MTQPSFQDQFSSNYRLEFNSGFGKLVEKTKFKLFLNFFDRSTLPAILSLISNDVRLQPIGLLKFSGSET
jgi:hypothetical protein